ncbi:MAG: hypothetical protein MZV64_23145 [Ignavibacteriales bacterium]|nr:hypothetical protein [Ignavibacteriales bacterium]
MRLERRRLIVQPLPGDHQFSPRRAEPADFDAVLTCGQLIFLRIRPPRGCPDGSIFVHKVIAIRRRVINCRVVRCKEPRPVRSSGRNCQLRHKQSVQTVKEVQLLNG